jgi:hypothetical protein
MERRKIVAAIVKIANELDSIGMYEEANELTKVAQAAGAQFMQGLRDIGQGTMRGIKGLGRDIGKGLESGYETTKQGFSDANELLENMGSESGYNLGAGKREFEMGYANISNQRIDSQIQALKDQVAQGRKSGITQKAEEINSLIEEKVSLIMNGPGGQTTNAKNEVNALRQKQFEVRKLRDSFKPGNPATMINRSNEGQFGTAAPEIIAFVDNRARGNNKTKAQIYEMAINERDENFANNVAAYLSSQGYRNRTDIVKPHGR